MDPEKEAEVVDTEIATEEAPIVETVETETEGLSLREALEVGLEKTQESKNEDSSAGVSESGSNAGREAEKRSDGVDSVSAAGGTRSDGSGSAANAAAQETAGQKPIFDAPAEWSKEEKEDFQASSPKAQAAALRLHKARQGKLEEIKREAAELQWAKDYAKEVTTFAKVHGEKEPTQAQILKALKVTNEISKAKNLPEVIEVLKAKNIPVPAELERAASEEKTSDPVNNAVLERLNRLESERAEEARAKVTQTLNHVWSGFERETNAAGAPKYPDLGNHESGLRLASSIGSLVGGETELSKQFIAMVQQRIPGATYPKLLEEAYRYCGGRVDDSQPPKTQSTQQHIARARRAASIVPGSAMRNGTSNARRSLPLREAIQAAIEQENELQE